ncbi:MAG: hypothetical protein R3343_13180 [Nitriliruptorales bacterium]|nr:hypothetical protein [Nitriliruptorales bacterium]
MCDTMVHVAGDRVLFAKNSDRDPNESQLLEWRPAQDHADGTMVACTHLAIRQAPHTHAVLLSRPFWMWGAEMGTNEHGVTIGNEAVFTDQPYADVGLTGMDLLRLALERAVTAREAVDVIVSLLETHGQGGSHGHEDPSFTYHNSYLVADPGGAFVLETAGRRWAVEEVTSGGRSISNGLTIEGFAQAHADPLRTHVSACTARRAFTEPAAAAATGPLDLARVLRQHGTDLSPDYALLNGAMAAPCMHAGGLVAASQTTASWMSELTADRARHWATGTSAPCTGVFLPVSVDAPTDLGPAPTDRFDPDTLWWRHELLHRSALRDPAASFPLFTPERDELERGWFLDPPSTDEAVAHADARRRDWTQRVNRAIEEDRRPWYVRRYWRIRDERAGVPELATAT